MKRYLVVLAIALMAKTCSAITVIVLDEGINSDRPWKAKAVTEPFQLCSSSDTIYQINSETNEVSFSHLSLCKDGTAILFDSENASVYKDEKNYTVNGQDYEQIIWAKDEGQTLRGEHGNTVSNALFSFDKSILQSPVQVFGIELNLSDPTQRVWTTSYYDPSKTPDKQNEPPAFRILRMLNHIAYGDLSTTPGFNQLLDLGAINISVVVRGARGRHLCNTNEGLDEVIRLRDKGIAVVAGLDNKDYKEDDISWPACLPYVIGVAGLNSPGIGAGQNNMDFFADDHQSEFNGFTAIGNSNAAPRVAAAFAILHEIYPSSTWIQKYTALTQSNNSKTRRTGDATYKRPFVDRRNMIKAISELGKVAAPAPLKLPDDTFKRNYGDFWGPVFNDNSEQASILIDFPNINPSSKVSEGLYQKSTAELEGLPRDILVTFSAIVGGNGDAMRLWVNGRELAEFRGFPTGVTSQAQYVIHRKHLSSGTNQISIRPQNASSDWGVTNIKFEYLPIVELNVGIADTSEYGYESVPRYPSGLRASFDLTSVPSGGVDILMRGKDIDVPSEISVFVNGLFLGRLSETDSNAFGDVDAFEVMPARLKTGTNYIELIQRETGTVWSGSDDEYWGVKDILIQPRSSSSYFNPLQQVPPVLPAINFLLLDD